MGLELERLKIDRSRGPRRGRRGSLARRAVLLGSAALLLFLFRAPLLGLYEGWTLPAVELAQAIRQSPLAASADAGTAANGYIVADRRAALSADTPGRVVEMNVKEGSFVRKGDVVARLYAEEYEAALRRAEAELEAARAGVASAEAAVESARSRLATLRTAVEAAQARLEDAGASLARSEADHARAVRLREEGAGTQQDLDDSRTQLDRAVAGKRREEALLGFARSQVAEGEAELRVAEARLGEARAQVGIREAARDESRATLAKTFVRAPFDGVVVLKDAEVGEVVSPNSQGASSRGSVVTMVDLGSLEVQVEMPERTRAAVEVGAPAHVYLDAYPEVRYTGAVSRIWSTANRQKGTIELRVRFDEPDGRLLPEMGARVVFLPRGAEAGAPAAAGPPVVLVPDACVAEIGGRSGVFALERDRARWRPVELGERRGDRVVVKAGLEGGERVVLRPPASLEDGARVRAPE